MAKKIQLSIAEPCPENWDAMTPDSKGKFCGSCQKQVVDFSDMSDRQVAEFFKKPSPGSVCGRFMIDQLDRAMEIPRKRIPWVKYFFQIAIPAFLLSIKASGQTKGKVKVNTIATDTTRKPIYKTMGLVATPVRPIADTVVKPVIQPVKCKLENFGINPTPKDPGCALQVMGGVKVADPMLMDKKSIEGIVINEKGDPVSFATIETNTGMIAMADENGNFSMPRKYPGDKDEWVISSVNYDTKKMIISKNFPGRLIIQLKGNVFLGEVVVTAMGVTKRTTVTMGYTNTVKGETTATILRDTVAKKNTELAVADKIFFIYPNPVVAGSSVNISLKNSAEGYYQLQLLSQAGQVVRQHEIWIDAEARLMDIEIPVVAAGSYIMVLGNKKTGQKFTEKIIIK